MSDLVEIKLGYIDIYHGKQKASGNSPKAPDFEGTIKINGETKRFKAWSELREGITKGERFSGYIYEFKKNEVVE